MKSRVSAVTWVFCLYAVATLISQAAMSIAAGLLALAILLWAEGPRGFWWELQRELGKPTLRRYARFSVFLVGACLLSLAVAKFWPVHIGGRQVEVHLLKDGFKLWYFFWPLVLVVGLKWLTEYERTFVLRAWVIGFAVLSLIGIAQYFTGWPRPHPIPGNLTRYHATLFLGHHLSVASIFIFPFFAVLDFLRKPQSAAGPRISRGGLGFAALAGLITLFLTYSRMLWLSLPIGIALWLLWSLPKRLAIASTCVLVLAGIVVSQVPAVRLRLHDAIGISSREELWNANLQFFKSRPLTGVGLHHNQELSGYYLMDKYRSSEVFSGHAHNNFLDVLAGTGAVGAIAWLLWVGFVFWICIKAAGFREPLGFSRALVCAWLVFQINGLTQVNFWEGKVLHQMMWVTAWVLFWMDGHEKRG